MLLEKNADKIAALITRRTRKVLADAHGELQRGIENVEYAATRLSCSKGEHSRNVGPASIPGASSSRWASPQASPLQLPAMVPLWMWPGGRGVATRSCSNRGARSLLHAVHRPARC